MLRRALLMGCFTLSGCARHGPVDCDSAEETIFACMDGDEARRFLAKGDSRAFFEKCIPMSKPEMLHGTWTSDFEFNVFREDEVIKGDQAFKLPKRWVELIVDGTELQRLWSANGAQSYQVTFVGRKPVCNLTEPVRHILVENVTSLRVIERRLSMHP